MAEGSANLESRVASVETEVHGLRSDVVEIKQSLASLVKRTQPNLSFWAILVTVIMAGIGGAYTLQSKDNDRMAEALKSTAASIDSVSRRMEAKFDKLDAEDKESLKDRTKSKADMVEAETQFRYQEMLIALLWKKSTGDDLPMPPFRTP